MPSTAAPSAGLGAQTAIGSIVERARVRSQYQPIVELSSGEVVAYEALARGPAGSELERPDALFAAARSAGLETELDWECQRAAMAGALDAGMPPGRALFVNVEPGALAARPRWLRGVGAEALGRYPIFAEFTERSLTDRPAQLLAAAERLRRQGVGIALDDVGADPRSLALMPFLAPDVIKLDLSLVQDNPSPRIAEIVHAVGAEAERSGAQILAEGIETEAHREIALALGAVYGQGWLFGRPGPLAPAAPASAAPIARPGGGPGEAPFSPFEEVTQSIPARRGTKRLLLALSVQIEARTHALESTAVLLSSFQEARNFTPSTRRRYGALAERAALVGAFGRGLGEEPAPGVRGVTLETEDPLRGEWDVAVIDPHFAVAFVARELGDAGPDLDRRFDFAVTYDRRLAVRAAAAMMGRLSAV